MHTQPISRRSSGAATAERSGYPPRASPSPQGRGSTDLDVSSHARTWCAPSPRGDPRGSNDIPAATTRRGFLGPAPVLRNSIQRGPSPVPGTANPSRKSITKASSRRRVVGLPFYDRYTPPSSAAVPPPPTASRPPPTPSPCAPTSGPSPDASSRSSTAGGTARVATASAICSNVRRLATLKSPVSSLNRRAAIMIKSCRPGSSSNSSTVGSVCGGGSGGAGGAVRRANSAARIGSAVAPTMLASSARSRPNFLR